MAEKKKPTEAEVQAWLEGVHFSSCCSDPLPEESITDSETVRVEEKATHKSKASNSALTSCDKS